MESAKRGRWRAQSSENGDVKVASAILRVLSGGIGGLLEMKRRLKKWKEGYVESKVSFILHEKEVSVVLATCCSHEVGDRKSVV